MRKHSSQGNASTASTSNANLVHRSTPLKHAYMKVSRITRRQARVSAALPWSPLPTVRPTMPTTTAAVPAKAYKRPPLLLSSTLCTATTRATHLTSRRHSNFRCLVPLLSGLRISQACLSLTFTRCGNTIFPTLLRFVFIPLAPNNTGAQVQTSGLLTDFLNTQPQRTTFAAEFVPTVFQTTVSSTNKTAATTQGKQFRGYPLEASTIARALTLPYVITDHAEWKLRQRGKHSVMDA